MSAAKRATAEVPIGYRASEIRWLVIEADESSRGWYLFLHRSLEEPSEFDSWHLTREDALKEAETRWGVLKDNWRSEVA